MAAPSMEAKHRSKCNLWEKGLKIFLLSLTQVGGSWGAKNLSGESVFDVILATMKAEEASEWPNGSPPEKIDPETLDNMEPMIPRTNSIT